MTDTTQGVQTPDDTALFNEATTTDTLEKFENPPVPAPAAPKGDEPKPEPPKEPPKPDDSAPVPPGRLREEAEARRRAERERDELQRQLAALRPPQPAPKQVDMFENPQGFVHQELKPFLEQIRADFQNQREAMSLDWALQKHGDEKVGSARQALEQGMARGDPNAWGTYNRAMQSHDPYGVIVRWHAEGETLRTVGGDIEAYNKRYREQLIADPEFRKQVIEAAKGQAAASGNSVARPVAVASSPSLGNVGAAGGDPQYIEPSDAELFRAATQAKRR